MTVILVAAALAIGYIVGHASGTVAQFAKVDEARKAGQEFAWHLADTLDRINWGDDDGYCWAVPAEWCDVTTGLLDRHQQALFLWPSWRANSTQIEVQFSGEVTP